MDTGSTSEVEEVEVEVVGPLEKGRLVEHLPLAGQKRKEVGVVGPFPAIFN
jgi:hypothetical protein